MEVNTFISFIVKLSFYNENFRNSSGEEVSFRLFLSGDYEFLCHMYGLSGASGMHQSKILTQKIQAGFFLQGVIAACGV